MYRNKIGADGGDRCYLVIWSTHLTDSRLKLFVADFEKETEIKASIKYVLRLLKPKKIPYVRIVGLL
jgi:hypothetical protein